MAADSHPGDFVLDIAKTGQALMNSFTKFITYRKVQDRRLENLYATLSLTAMTLTELGTTINKYENDFRIKNEVFRPICETAKANLEKFLVLINEGITAGVWKNDGTLGGQAFTAEVDPWLLITVSLGGREQAKNFWKSLDDTRDSLLELNDIVKYMILKNLGQRSVLDQQQSDELKNLTALLPHLVHSVEKAEAVKQREAAIEKEIAERINRPVEVEINPRRQRDDASEITLFAEPKPRGRKIQIAKDYDTRNSSFESFTSSEAPSLPENREVHEEWLLRWGEPIKNLNSSSTFLGLKIKRYYEDLGYWGLDPQLRTQEELKEQHLFAAGDLSRAKHKEMMQKAVRAIPKKGGVIIDQLLEDRARASNNEDVKTVWEVVAIRPQEKHTYSCSKKWGKDPKTTDWLVTIRGEKIDTTERSQPFKNADPWWSPHPRYRRPIPRVYERERSYSPVRRTPIISPPAPPVWSRRRREPLDAIPDDGFRPGNLVIGKILSKEEAEEKMEEIWARMTTGSQVTEDVVAE